MFLSVHRKGCDVPTVYAGMVIYAHARAYSGFGQLNTRADWKDKMRGRGLLPRSSCSWVDTLHRPLLFVRSDAYR